ncbi:hypothetical protein Ahy_A07g032901 isoform D [Arachis hypogaea]|uniref:Uncharacterized protein n=1 Tax=Arachis hypogaea TaxID=3818 RepID=A0A445C7T3_ARAHY|nr:hypothetical protein Ahy_A07g032901 isoform D [Arachis hypogaea]
MSSYEVSNLPKNPSTVSLHHRRRKEWHTAAVRPSVYLASLVLQVFNPRSLSPIAAAYSSSASVVFVCSAALPPPLVAVNVRVFVQPSSSFAFFAVQVCSAFTVRVHSPFTVRVRVRLEATLPCFKLCDQPSLSQVLIPDISSSAVNSSARLIQVSTQTDIASLWLLIIILLILFMGYIT